MNILDLSHERSSTRLDHWVNNSYAWTQEEIHSESCILQISKEVEVELLR